MIMSSVCFRLLFKASCLWPTEGAKWGDRKAGLSVTDLNGQTYGSFGLPYSLHTHTHGANHRLSLGFWKDPKVNINFLMHFGSRGGCPQE